MIWTHLSQIPVEVREPLEKTNAAFADEDTRLEQATLQAIREARLVSRVQALCLTLHAQLPVLSIRKVFLAVHLISGLSEGHVRRLYYQRTKP